MFALIDLTVLGVTKQTPFYASLSVTYPFFLQTMKNSFILLCLSLCVALMFVSAIIRLCDQQIMLSNYILTRNSRVGSFAYMFAHSVKSLTVISLIKIACDLAFGQMQGTVNLKKVALTWLNMYLTVIIWCLIVFIMLWLRVPVKWTYFTITAGILLCQYSSLYVNVPSLFVFGSRFIMDNEMKWAGLKLLGILILFAANLAIIRKHEYINAKSDI